MNPFKLHHKHLSGAEKRKQKAQQERSVVKLRKIELFFN